MRLLMTADTLGGVWNYAVELIGQLGSRGVEVALATMGRPLSRSQLADLRPLRGAEVYESAFKLCWMEDPWDDVNAAGEWLLELADRVQPDLVHLNDYPHAAQPWEAPVLVVGHSCVLSWHRQVRHAAAGAEWNRYRRAVWQGLRAADLVVAPTRTMLAWLDRFYGPLGRRQAIRNGRRASSFSVGAKRPLVLTAGRLWDEAKNVATLVQAARHVQWEVCVAGEQRHPGWSADEAGDALEGVRLLGVLDPASLARWYAVASVYALPARYEPFGLTALEAALSGCALVLSDIPTLRELWGDAAEFVPPEEPQAWAEALNRLAAEPRRREALAGLALGRAQTMTAETMGEGYLAAYRSLLARETVGCSPNPHWLRRK